MTLSDEQIQGYKTAFAEALLKTPGEPHKAAFAAIPDVGLACQAAVVWPNDTFVRSEQIRLLSENGSKSFLTNKEQQARDIYEIAKDTRLGADDRLKAHRLYAEVMGFIEKPSSTTNVNVLNQALMVVKDHGNDDDWEMKAKAQQQRLIHGNVSAAN